MKKLLLVMAVMAYVLPANAADADIYGRLGMSAWWMKSERLHIGQATLDSVGIPVNNKDSIPLNTNIMEPSGILGIKLKGDRFGGCVEMGAKMNVYDMRLSGSPTFMLNLKKSSFFLTIEKWYAEWYINDFFTFLVGQDDVPTNFFISNQSNSDGTGLSNVGCLHTGAYPMFQFSAHDADKRFEGKVAAIMVDTSVIEHMMLFQEDAANWKDYHCETAMPKLEGSFGVNLERDFFAFNGKIVGGLQKYNSVIFTKQVSADSARFPIESWVGGADLGVKVGPVRLGFDIFYGKNIGVYGQTIGYKYGWWRKDDYMRAYYPAYIVRKDGWEPIDTAWYDSKVWEMAALINVKPFDFLSFEMGGGMVCGRHDYDLFNNYLKTSLSNSYWWGGESTTDYFWDRTYAWYVQAEIKLFEQLILTPEGGQVRFAKYRRYFYWGMNSMIEF